MDKSDPCDPYSRPARRTQWIVSTLAYHYGLDRGVENEIIVLATGLDQYLQEIFHHLDCLGEGKVSAEDFKILCEVLGLNNDLEECAGVLDDIPDEITFRQFHAKLCGYFSTKAGCQYENGRLLVGKESEHIETQIRLRSPLRRRKKSLSVGENGRGSRGSSPPSERHASHYRKPGSCSCTRECYEEIVALEEAEDRVVKLEDENASLRELVEDMRAALQSSDARSLALQVGLWKSHANHGAEEGCFIASRRRLNHKTSTQSNIKCLQSFLQEIELIRSSRDGQIEEAMRFNQELEKELGRSQEALLILEDCNRNLKREQADMRKKVEDARQAVHSSLGKVKELEAKANHVPLLQRHVQQLESELNYYSRVHAKQSMFPGPQGFFSLPPDNRKVYKAGRSLPETYIQRFCDFCNEELTALFFKTVTQVGLWKSHANHGAEEGCFIASRRRLNHKTSTQSNIKCLQSFLQEIELIRSSRDGQIEEAMRFNQELEKELGRSQEALLILEDCNRNLKREQADMRKKVEDARQAVHSSLGKVKELEAKANHVPLLQRHVQQLESELNYYR
ncbi:EF-hand and coiled-coil domain-containing protein 1 [Acipenser ruthenus]|uniref:EF-hand and coiled-coil domain-containing protein 1 n=1 Tax=Acipenser ruthenus TaxID=7906 RepID=A0A444V296_ACIRT|nr:EF-hand and coiled-coil domain-containing protein 1 [Acipenser ruthenus]